MGNTIGRVQGTVVKPSIRAAAANPPVQAETKAESGWSWSDLGHGLLDLGGMIPEAGFLFDGANALWYTAEGNYGEAAISAASAAMDLVPGGGIAAKVGKYGSKAVRAVVKHLPQPRPLAHLADGRRGYLASPTNTPELPGTSGTSARRSSSAEDPPKNDGAKVERGQKFKEGEGASKLSKEDWDEIKDQETGLDENVKATVDDMFKYGDPVFVARKEGGELVFISKESKLDFYEINSGNSIIRWNGGMKGDASFDYLKVGRYNVNGGDFKEISVDEVMQGRFDIKPDRLADVRRAIESGTQLNPIVVEWTREGLKIVDGNHRYQASIDLGLKIIPVKYN
ncbi:ParB N-terminal domain-containing protein [Burkholderia sp. F1]|uniref:ParB N-terminal domain-containing protein n=1 Tax=Burkholderia sp. F1 TaxID=3366817 RepID=UPI003D72D4C6